MIKTTLQNCQYLTVDEVCEVHEIAIAEFGGIHGIRDQALLESAVAAPQASFGGQSPYSDVIEVAAAYFFYLCRNHPFIDGNKRVALGSCLTFLRINGFFPCEDGEVWENLTMGVAASILDRDELTLKLRELVS